MSSFQEQFRENCRQYTRQTPIRLLKLAVAFVAAFVLGSLCYLVEGLTGSRTAVLFVLVPGVLFVLALWLLFLRRLGAALPEPQAFQPVLMASSPDPLSGSDPWSPAGFPAPQPFVPATPAAKPEWNTPGPAFGSAPQPAFPSPPRPASGSGWTVALLAILGVVMLSCCGGGLVLAGLASFTTQVGSPAGFESDDPFAEMHARNQQNLDEMRRRHEEQMRRIERDRDRMMNRPGW
jgi:hypothetical protein